MTYSPAGGAPERTFCQDCQEPVRLSCSCPLGRAARAEWAQVGQDRSQVAADQTTARTNPIIAEAAHRLGGTPGKIAHAVVPRSSVEMSFLPEERRDAFVAHLDEIIAEAFDEEGDLMLEEPEMFEDRETIEPADPMAVTLTCIACRGHCCRNGADRMAFLTMEMMVYYRLRDPEITNEEIREDYLAYLPELTQTDSCVYHGDMGCTLPRQLRANLCNTWRCAGQKKMVEEVAAKGAARALAVALIDDHSAYPNAGDSVHLVATVGPGDRVAVIDDIPAPALKP